MDKCDVLRGAREVLTKDFGWAQGSYVSYVYDHDDDDVLFCAVGACLFASDLTVEEIDAEDFSYPNMPATVEAVDALAEELGDVVIAPTAVDVAPGQKIPEGLPKVVKWNDDPGRTEEEVLALFDRTIARICSS